MTTTEVTLYRAGDPSSGEGFWTPDENYARSVHPEGALHEARLLVDFKLKRFEQPRSVQVVGAEQDSKEFDVLLFTAPDGRIQEFVVLNPQALKVMR
jgi:hypothetical protein